MKIFGMKQQGLTRLFVLMPDHRFRNAAPACFHLVSEISQHNFQTAKNKGSSMPVYAKLDLVIGGLYSHRLTLKGVCV